MVLLESLNLKLGQTMPSFSLSDPLGNNHHLDTVCQSHQGTIVAFTCNHCPYAIAIWPRLISLAKWAKSHQIATLAINPNIHPSYPDDSPENMIQKINEWDIPFPYLVDQDQEVAKQYEAQCTPDIYFLNQNKSLIYHGRLDDNWQNPDEVTEQSLKQAIDTFLNTGKSVTPQFPSMGCSIKWQ